MTYAPYVKVFFFDEELFLMGESRVIFEDFVVPKVTIAFVNKVMKLHAPIDISIDLNVVIQEVEFASVVLILWH